MDYSRFKFAEYEYREYPKWVDGRIVESPEDEPRIADERAELVAEAEARGIAVDKRWGIKKLREILE